MSMKLSPWLCLGVGVIVLGCSTQPSAIFDTSNGDGGPDGDQPDSEVILPPGNDASSVALIVTPPSATLQASGSPVTQQFQALDPQTNNPLVANWSMDNVGLGSIDATGLFTALGTVGGIAHIDAVAGTSKGSAIVNVNVTLTDNPGNVNAGNQALLKGGGAADPGFKWLYPYDATVMPRGLKSPVMQFDGIAPDGLMIHMKATNIDYTGFYGASTPGQLQVADVMWKQVLASVTASDPLTVQMTKLSGGKVTGPITRTWSVAQGTMRGNVFYNTYSNGGEMFKLKVGGTAQSLLTNCKVCHSASANGNVLASTDGTYDLTKNAAPLINAPGSRAYSFAAVYPDGTFLLTTYTTSPGSAGISPVELRDSKTGNKISAPGMDGTAIQPAMPAFSPDGTKIVFNDGNSQTLSVMDFDVKTKKFSNKVTVLTSQKWPGWPQLTPDNKYVLFHDDSSQEMGTRSGQLANVRMLEIATKKVVALDALNGISGGKPYMPYGSNEIDMNYEPTILPIAVGGYYWVVFTSRRCYGNTLTPSLDPDAFAYGTARRKKLWLAALDVTPQPNKDPSHPALYLPGQDLQPGNMRGFWSLDPCKPNGTACNEADECCGGFCRQSGNMKVCVPPPTGCSNEFEACTTAGDCCSGTALCINGHCATPTPN